MRVMVSCVVSTTKLMPSHNQLLPRIGDDRWMYVALTIFIPVEIPRVLMSEGVILLLLDDLLHETEIIYVWYLGEKGTEMKND